MDALDTHFGKGASADLLRRYRGSNLKAEVKLESLDFVERSGLVTAVLTFDPQSDDPGLLTFTVDPVSRVLTVCTIYAGATQPGIYTVSRVHFMDWAFETLGVSEVTAQVTNPDLEKKLISSGYERVQGLELRLLPPA